MATSSSKPTGKDVARIAGVSQSTVSRVLNETGIELISEETIKRVRAAATKMGYVPNPFARALRGKETQLIGLVVREMADPFFASLISEISIQASHLGYRVVLAPAHSDPDEALKATTTLYTQHTDGVIFLGDLRDDEPAIRKILQEHRAVVTMCRGSKLQDVLTINTDSRRGIHLLLDHLTGLGHRRFAFLDGGWLGDIHERRSTFVDYLRDAEPAILQARVESANNDAEGGYRAMKSLLESSHHPTAVLASDDIMAIGAIKAVFDSGLDVPADVSITGFDDIELARYLHPALTTVEQPVRDMSAQALQLLLDAVKGEVPETRVMQVEPKLVVRESTGPPPGGDPLSN
ncbi:MAG: LacI family DNA-binding transcriptional regulator [Anaerolineae bacterium]|nr:LacI family DNA-binding transcriptional regulator [Anaerolineae bacterium]